MFTNIVSTTAAILMLSVTSIAESAEPGGFLTAQGVGETLSTDLIGREVTSSDGNWVGEIDSLVLNEQLQVTGAVISVGGFLGIGEKQIGLDWSQFQQVDGAYRLNLSAEALADAPEYKDLATLLVEEQQSLPSETQGSLPDRAPPVTE